VIDAFTESVDDTGDLVPGDPRKLEIRPQRVGHELIAVTDAARVDPHADLPRSRFGQSAVFRDEWFVGRAYDHRFHECLLVELRMSWKSSGVQSSEAAPALQNAGGDPPAMICFASASGFQPREGSITSSVEVRR
jgi:hypothetical protein